MSDIPLRVEGLTKQFQGTVALDNVTLEVRPREVVGLIGQNGAGKSTLLKLLAGLYTPDAGKILVNGVERNFSSVAEAARNGIGMVFQEQAIIPNITVAENVFLGNEDEFIHGGMYRWPALYAKAKAGLDRIGSRIMPTQLPEQLSFSERQMVEIARALAIEDRAGGAPVILLDEPTSLLNAAEVDILFEQIDRLRGAASFVFVSHRLDEVLRISDRVYVMRDGKCVAERDPKTCTHKDLFQLMVGSELSEEFYLEGRQAPKVAADVRCSAQHLSLAKHYHDVSFDLHKGEILGIAGVQGSGREAVARTLFGAETAESGKILLDGEPIVLRTPADAVRLGIGYVPSERRIEGFVQGMSIADNIALVGGSATRKGLFISRGRERGLARTWIDRLRIRTRSEAARVDELSGGNQQKVVMAKWLTMPNLRMLILDHPTRGVDMGAKADLYELIRGLAARGVIIVLLSDTLEETIALSDTVMAMRDGAVSGVFAAPPGAKPSQPSIIERML